MDYVTLAEEFIERTQSLNKASTQKFIDKALKGESLVLQCIARHGREVLPGEIGVEINVSSARIAQTLNSMEEKGLIARRIDRDDRRRILVSLTEQGKGLAEKHQRFMIDTIAKMLGLLGERDATEYVRITGRLAELVPESLEQAQRQDL